MIVYSSTNLKTYRDCPRKFQAHYVTKEVPYVENAALRRGNHIHDLMEAACKHGWESVVWDEDKTRGTARGYVEAIKRLRDSGWTVQVELEAATDGLGMPTGWWDKDSWGRSKIDIAATHPDMDYAIVIDWKTGKPWDDELQLHFNAMCLAPHVHRNKFNIMFAYLDSNTTRDYTITLDIDKPALFNRVEHMHSPVMPTLLIVEQLKEAFAKNNFPATKMRFCNSCLVPGCVNKKG